MKYGVNLMVWTTRVGREQESLLLRIREWGFDGAELFLTPEEPTRIPEVRQMLDHAGLERTTCSVLPRDAHLPSSQAEVRAQAVQYLERCVERTADLGATLVCGPLYAGLGFMTGGRRTLDEWKWAAEGLRKVARRGQQLGVTLCIEPLNRFETYFLNTQQDAFNLIQDVGEPNLGIHFDTFHANIEERNSAEALRSIAARLGHVHISENDRGVPGCGHVDWRGIFSVLKEVGYSGWLTIESFAQPEPQLASAACIWRDLASSGDQLASEGLKFIKRLAGELGIT